MRPRSFRVDVIRRHRRHATPVVDAGADELLQRSQPQIGRRLDVHGRPEHQPGDGNRPQMILERGLRRVSHPGAGLGPEVLDDDLLDVAVAIVKIAQGKESLDAL